MSWPGSARYGHAPRSPPQGCSLGAWLPRRTVLRTPPVLLHALLGEVGVAVPCEGAGNSLPWDRPLVFPALFLPDTVVLLWPRAVGGATSAVSDECPLSPQHGQSGPHPCSLEVHISSLLPQFRGGLDPLTLVPGPLLSPVPCARARRGLSPGIPPYMGRHSWPVCRPGSVTQGHPWFCGVEVVSWFCCVGYDQTVLSPRYVRNPQMNPATQPALASQASANHSQAQLSPASCLPVSSLPSDADA